MFNLLLVADTLGKEFQNRKEIEMGLGDGILRR
jgi:hypothetical protein